jgi:hypothetical protein
MRRVPAELPASMECDRLSGCQQSSTLISNPRQTANGGEVDAIAHNVEHETIKGTKTARHLERIDQFDRAGNIHRDGLGTRLPELNIETQPSSAMSRKFDEALGMEPAFKDETRMFMGHRRSVR